MKMFVTGRTKTGLGLYPDLLAAKQLYMRLFHYLVALNPSCKPIDTHHLHIKYCLFPSDTFNMFLTFSLFPSHIKCPLAQWVDSGVSPHIITPFILYPIDSGRTKNLPRGRFQSIPQG